MVLVLQRITLSMDDRSGFKRLFWKSLGEPNPAYVEKEDQLKQVNRGRGRPSKAPEFSGSLLWLVASEPATLEAYDPEYGLS